MLGKILVLFTKTLALCLITSMGLLAQGNVSKSNDGSIKGSLELMPCATVSGNLQKVPSPFPDKTDPALASQNWMYSDDKSVAVRGFVKEAALHFQWWTLLGDPIERYAFKWITTGYYEVMYQEKGQTVTKQISRSSLLKYPDLLKKFDNIEPFNVNVEITFSSGDIDEQKYYDFRRKYNINTDLGSADYKGSYTIESKGVHYLFARSGEDPPFIIPTMPVGGWRDWLNITDTDNDRMKKNIELFRLGRVIHIQSFKITDIDWFFGEFTSIAKTFEQYENGELSPKEVVDNTPLGTKADGGDDFWNESEVLDLEMEVYRDPTTSKYGLKAKKGLRAIPAEFDQLEACSSEKNTFIGRQGDNILAVNGSGKTVASMYGKGWYITSTGAYRSIQGEETGCSYYEVNFRETVTFTNGSFSAPERTYTIEDTTWKILWVNGTPSEEDKKRWKAECYQTAQRIAQSSGYKKAGGL